jgi:hypothetical protein
LHARYGGEPQGAEKWWSEFVKAIMKPKSIILIL